MDTRSSTIAAGTGGTATASPEVSVVIPTHNRSALLKAAVDSVLQQGFRDHEIVVVDDGSTDDTVNVLKGYDGRVRWLRQPNRGASAARNAGVRASKGQLVAFLDDDDRFLPDKLAVQVHAMSENPEAGMSYTGAYLEDPAGHRLARVYEAWLTGDIYRRLVWRGPYASPIAAPTVMVRRAVLDAVGGFDEAMPVAEDNDLWRRIARRYPVLAIQQPLSVVRLRAESADRDPEETWRSVDRYVRRTLEEDPDMEAGFRRRGIAEMCLHYAEALLKSVETGRHPAKTCRRVARHFAARAISCRPLLPGAWRLWAEALVGHGAFRTPKRWADRIRNRPARRAT